MKTTKVRVHDLFSEYVAKYNDFRRFDRFHMIAAEPGTLRFSPASHYSSVTHSALGTTSAIFSAEKICFRCSRPGYE